MKLPMGGRRRKRGGVTVVELTDDRSAPQRPATEPHRTAQQQRLQQPAQQQPAQQRQRQRLPAQQRQPPPLAVSNLLLDLPDHLLASVCLFAERRRGGASSLACLESAARHFRHFRGQLQSSGAPASLMECAAESLLRLDPGSWRVVAQPGERLIHCLQVLRCHLWPLPQVAAGGAHTLLAPAAGGVICCGSNSDNQLGASTEQLEQRSQLLATEGHVRDFKEDEPISVGVLEEQNAAVALVAAGINWSAALEERTGRLWTWGGGTSTQPIGIYRSLPQDTRVAYVALGVSHAACVSAEGELFTWGDGQSGRLGHVERHCGEQCGPRRVDALWGAGGRAAGRRRVVGVDCGAFTTAAVTACSELWMMGDLPQKPNQDRTATLAYCDVTGVRLPFGSWYHEWQSDNPRDLCPYQYEIVPAGHKHRFKLISSIAQFKKHSRLSKAYLEGGFWRHAFLPEQIIVPHAQGPFDLDIRHVSCGERHFAFINDEGEAYTWGFHGHGRLGHGNRCQAMLPRPRRVEGLEGKTVVVVSAGDEHTVAVTSTGEVWGWGSSAAGRLGLGAYFTGPGVNVPLPLRMARYFITMPSFSCPCPT